MLFVVCSMGWERDFPAIERLGGSRWQNGKYNSKPNSTLGKRERKGGRMWSRIISNAAEKAIGQTIIKYLAKRQSYSIGRSPPLLPKNGNNKYIYRESAEAQDTKINNNHQMQISSSHSRVLAWWAYVCERVRECISSGSHGKYKNYYYCQQTALRMRRMQYYAQINN